MNRALAAQATGDAAAFLSRIMRENKLAGKDLEEASDLAIDLHLLSKHLRNQPMVIDPT